MQPRVASPSLFRFSKELRQRHPQGPRNLAQVQDGDVALASFDRADEGPVQVAFRSQVSLGHLEFDPPLAAAKTQMLQKMALVEIHA